MSAFWQNCINLLVACFQAVLDIFYDIFVKIFGELLGIISYVISLIPFPQALEGGLNSFLSGVSGDIMYFVGVVGFASSISIIGGAYAFRIVRKFLTLFQW